MAHLLVIKPSFLKTEEKAIKELEKLYEGKWSKKKILQHSLTLELARDLRFPKKELSKIAKKELKSYSDYKRELRRLHGYI